MSGYTARLTNWNKFNFGKGVVYTGDIQGDVRGRWPDGTRIQTSKVVRVERDGMVHTLNSVYKLEGPKAE